MSSPASLIIGKFGGPRALATLLGLHTVSVYRWTYPSSKGGTNGLIPTRHQNRLLALARSSGIGLRPADFFHFQGGR